MKSQYPGYCKLVAAGLLSLPILLYGMAQFSRPARTADTKSLYAGVTYQRQAPLLPRPVMIHVITIRLNTPGLRAFVTPANNIGDKTETSAMATSEFVRKFGVQLAINANFFFPFREETPWDFYPRPSDRVNLVGQAISDGKAYSLPDTGWATLCFLPNRARIEESGNCLPETQQAVAGNALLVKAGKPVGLSPEDVRQDKPYPRTAVGLDQTGQTLWLVVVDGKQFRYSEGLTTAELAEFMVRLGAESALNLDGGGSVTLAAQTESGVKVLNAPIHTRIPMRERPVAVHLGFYASKR